MFFKLDRFFLLKAGQALLNGLPARQPFFLLFIKLITNGYSNEL